MRPKRETDEVWGPQAACMPPEPPPSGGFSAIRTGNRRRRQFACRRPSRYARSANSVRIRLERFRNATIRSDSSGLRAISLRSITC